MSFKFKYHKAILVVGTFILLISVVISCSKQLIVPHNNIAFQSKLSDYNIFSGNMSNLIPSDSFHLYNLSSQLFTDYAEKQRLIKLPGGTKLSAVDDNLLYFPEGTMLVKTFFYYADKRDTTKGKKIIETRLLIKHESRWNVATYVWDSSQADAYLQTEGSNTPVTWIDNTGSLQNLNYHIPANKECASCHNESKTVIPIGPKVRNLNLDVIVNGVSQNQLSYFANIGILNSVNPTSFNKLPDYNDVSKGLEKRARAYLEINCSHCHKQGGFNGSRPLYLAYEKNFEEANLKRYQDLIVLRMSQHRMPKLGTTIIHKEGFALVKAYVDSIP